jgi:hypothetical protein
MNTYLCGFFSVRLLQHTTLLIVRSHTHTRARVRARARDLTFGASVLAVVRHPFGNIRSLQSWYISKNTSDPGRLKVEVLAGLWARAARVYLDNPHIFAAHMRYEDLMARPVETIKQVGATLFFTTGAFELPPGGEEALLEGFDIQVKPAGTYPTFFNETETAVVLDLCGTEMASLNYSVADQWTNFSKEA